MENRAYALLAGLFTVVLLAALAGAALWLRDEGPARDRYLLVAQTSVAGLNEQAAVRLRGVEVGRVDSIRFDPTDPRNILIGVLIDRGTPISRGTVAQLGFQGVTGLAYIQLDDARHDPEPLVPQAGEPPRIPVRPSVIEQISDAGPQLIAQLLGLAQRAEQLLAADNQRLVVQTLRAVEVAASRAAGLAERATPALASIDRAAGEAALALRRSETVAADVRAVATRFDRLAGHAESVVLQIGQRLEAIDRVTRSVELIGARSAAVGDLLEASTLPRIGELAGELRRSSRTLERAVDELREQPQSLVFGRRAPAPGPGEPGFASDGGDAR